MKAIFKAIVVAMLVMLAPAMAFVPTIPSTIEQVGVGMDNGQITYDSASYSYTRAVADAGTSNAIGQNAYSGVLFGADQGVKSDGNNEGLMGGVVANGITTTPTGAVGLTRQVIEQTGTASVTTVPASYYDNENQVDTPVVKESISNTNLAWVSGDLTSFSATPSSFGVVGGNYIDPAYQGDVTGCGNVWLYENDPTAPTIKVSTDNGNLLDAYAGSASTASLTAFPQIPGTNGFFTPAKVTMSGYSENFAGYDGASVSPVDSSGSGDSVKMDIGTSEIVDSWNAHAGVYPFDNPVNSDFGTSGSGGGITWPVIGAATP